MTPELHQLTREVLEHGYLLSLGVSDEHGPWVADVIYVFDEDLNLYWMSSKERRHSRAIDEGYNRVAAAIGVTHGPDQPDEGLQISGTASRIEHSPLDLLQQWMRKKRKPVTSAIGAVLTGHEWYKLIPDRIELIYGAKFGHERQKVR